MTRDEFKQFVADTLEAVIQLAEKETGKALPRKIAFKWFSQTSAPLREGIVEHITDRVFIDEEHIYPCVDIGVGDILEDGTVLIHANITGYSPRPFQKNWTGRDGPFVYIVGQNVLDKLRTNDA
jgi:hypothetical protein